MGIAGDAFLYTSGVAACAKGAHWEGALILLTEVFEHSLKPTAVTYSSAISACEKGG